MTESDLPDEALIEDDTEKADVIETFAVKDEASANWVLKKILDARRYRQRVDDWAVMERQRARRTEAFFLNRYRGQLEAYLRQELNRRGNRQKSVNLPAGRLGFRHRNAKVVVEDQEALLDWCRRFAPDLIRTHESIDRAALSERFRETGEVPACGISVAPPHDALCLS